MMDAGYCFSTFDEALKTSGWLKSFTVEQVDAARANYRDRWDEDAEVAMISTVGFTVDSGWDWGDWRNNPYLKILSGLEKASYGALEIQDIEEEWLEHEVAYQMRFLANGKTIEETFLSHDWLDTSVIGAINWALEDKGLAFYVFEEAPEIWAFSLGSLGCEENIVAANLAPSCHRLGWRKTLELSRGAAAQEENLPSGKEDQAEERLRVAQESAVAFASQAQDNERPMSKNKALETYASFDELEKVLTEIGWFEFFPECAKRVALDFYREAFASEPSLRAAFPISWSSLGEAFIPALQEPEKVLAEIEQATFGMVRLLDIQLDKELKDQVLLRVNETSCKLWSMGLLEGLNSQLARSGVALLHHSFEGSDRCGIGIGSIGTPERSCRDEVSTNLSLPGWKEIKHRLQIEKLRAETYSSCERLDTIGWFEHLPTTHRHQLVESSIQMIESVGIGQYEQRLFALQHLTRELVCFEFTEGFCCPFRDFFDVIEEASGRFIQIKNLSVEWSVLPEDRKQYVIPKAAVRLKMQWAGETLETSFEVDHEKLPPALLEFTQKLLGARGLGLFKICPPWGTSQSVLVGSLGCEKQIVSEGLVPECVLFTRPHQVPC